MQELLKHLPGKHNQKLHAPKTVAPAAVGSEAQARIDYIKANYAIPDNEDTYSELYEKLDARYTPYLEDNWDNGGEAVSVYAGDAYMAINSKLRGTKPDAAMLGYGSDDMAEYEEFAAEAVEFIPAMDKAFKKAKPTPSNMVVFRAAPPEFVQGSQNYGDVFQDKGFVSTSLDSSFGETNGYAIAVPKGSKGLFIAEVAPNPEEAEFLLPRDSKFKYIGKDGGRTWLEYLGQ